MNTTLIILGLFAMWLIYRWTCAIANEAIQDMDIERRKRRPRARINMRIDQ